jgi:hypothetical protein
MKYKNSYFGVSLLILLSFCISKPSSVRADSAAMGLQNGLIGQSTPWYNPLQLPFYPTAQDSYFTDDAGNILMFVNILGQVNRNGQFVVRENADFATILALSGGLGPDANLTKVLVIRHEPDDNGKQAYVVNLEPFYKKGDRTEFITFKPNDTIIIPEKGISIRKIAQYIGIVSPMVYLYDVLNRY